MKIASAGALALLLLACSSDDDKTNPTSAPLTFSTAAAVTGAVDPHCAAKAVTVDPATCKAAAEGGDADYGPTQYNAEGDDDDCKYHVSWQSSPVGQNRDVTFTVTVKTKVGDGPVAGAQAGTEIFLDETHPAPNPPTATKSTETTSGSYTIGPVRFDAAGRWTVRFHLFESCNDGETSPHGHAAFFVQIP